MQQLLHEAAPADEVLRAAHKAPAPEGQIARCSRRGGDDEPYVLERRGVDGREARASFSLTYGSDVPAGGSPLRAGSVGCSPLVKPSSFATP